MTTSCETPLSILLVEDDVQDEALIVSIAQRHGLEFQHCCVDNAADFQDRLSDGVWDLIISDYNLPAFSVMEVLQILRDRNLDIPCIVISGYIGEEAAVSLMKAGACDFVAKGTLSRLVPAIRREVVEARNRLEKRKAEQSLRRNESLIAGIASALGEGLLVSDALGEVIFSNPEAQHLLGWNENQLLGKNLYQSIFYRNDYHGEPDGRFFEFNPQNGYHKSENELFVRHDGSIFNASYVSTPIFEDGKVAAIVTAFQDITSRKQAEQALIDSRTQLRELSIFLQTIREEERTRIARELHDELGQALTALKMDVAWLMSRLGDDQDELLSKTDSMLTMIDSTVDSVRRISANLRPGLLDDLGLAAAVEWLLDEFQKRTGVQQELQMSHEEFDFEPGLSTSVFRILQEAITNVARHACATNIYVLLEDLGDIVSLSVKDNGKGFVTQSDVGKRKSFGLLGIRERVAALGGHFEIQSQPQTGTELRVQIPKSIIH